MSTGLYREAGTLAKDSFSLVLTPQEAGRIRALRVLDLAPGESAEIATAGTEMLVLPLAARLHGRLRRAAVRAHRPGQRVQRGLGLCLSAHRRSGDDLFSKGWPVRAAGGERAAPPDGPLRPGIAVPVELRGRGACSRQVNNFCIPDAFEADRLIACEVLTPAGNWSSYPPHKHDTERPGECALEEIYYFEIGAGPDGPGVGYHRVYSSDDRPADLVAEVRSGDVVLVPYGWHGPSIAVPGFDMYYLNVMAGPGAERAWLICDDPAHAWIRGTWPGQPPDPRLPMTTSPITTPQ